MNIDPTTPAGLAELRKLLNEAAPTRWQYRKSGDGFKIDDEVCEVAGNYDYGDGGIFDELDAKLIVAAVNALPALLEHVERLSRFHDRMIEQSDRDEMKIREQYARLNKQGARLGDSGD